MTQPILIYDFIATRKAIPESIDPKNYRHVLEALWSAPDWKFAMLHKQIDAENTHIKMMTTSFLVIRSDDVFHETLLMLFIQRNADYVAIHSARKDPFSNLCSYKITPLHPFPFVIFFVRTMVKDGQRQKNPFYNSSSYIITPLYPYSFVIFL